MNDEAWNQDIDVLLAKLQARFIPHQPYRDLQEQFGRLLRRRRAALALGTFTEGKGIAVVGASGSGKTTAVNRLLSKHSELARTKEDVELAEVVSLQVPSPATLKYVGSSMLNALGYPLTRDKPAAFIWDQVRHLLKHRQTLFVHLDEAQDLYSNTSPVARDAVVNTLKSLMNNKDWPVGLILSGMPRIVELINIDDQLKRRISIVHLNPVTMSSHGGEVTPMLARYADAAGLMLGEGLREREFCARLVHAGANELGLIIEAILAGIEEALYLQSAELGCAHFAESFRRKSGCVPAFNPFLATDFLRIDVRRVFGSEEVQ